MTKKNKCKTCGKNMTDAEYIEHLEKEVARLEQELLRKKNINVPWTDPNAYPYKWVGWPSTTTWSATNWPPYDIMQPTGDMCSNTCRLNELNASGGCIQCGRMQPPMGTGLL